MKPSDVTWNCKTHRRLSVTSSESIAAKHLELLLVNQGIVIVSTPTMDSTLGCFKYRLIGEKLSQDGV